MATRKRLRVEPLEDRALMKSPDDAPSLGPPPEPSSNVIWVDTVAELQSAVENLQSNQTIVVEPGSYPLTRTLFIGKDNPVQNVTIRGATDDFNDVVITGLGMDGPFDASLAHGISVYNAQDVTIANLSVGEVYWHAVDLQGGAGAERVSLYHCRFFDAGEQILKSNSGGGGADDGRIEYCLIEFTDGPSRLDHGGGTGYTGGLHAHQTDRWIIRHNVWRNFHTPDDSAHLFAPVVLMWNDSADTVVEGNTFIDCDRAVAFGLVDRAGGTDHRGGVIRNNFVWQRPGLFSAFRRSQSDGQLLAYDSPGTKVLHNTVMTNGNSRFSIEVRWGNTGVAFDNNLADAPLNARDGGAYTAAGNALQAVTGMFVDPAAGDLHLLDTPPTRATVIDRGTAGMTEDFDGEPRETPDVGADELSAPNAPPTATDDDATLGEDQTLSLDPRANDSDPDGDALEIVSVTQPSHGQVTLTPTGVEYRPEAGFVGDDEFTYTISDGRGGTDTAAVRVTVEPRSNTVALEPDPWHPGRQALVVRGTAGDDAILFRPDGKRFVAVEMNGVDRGRFPIAAARRLVARGQAGDDRIEVVGTLPRPVQFDGGAGDDTLTGGSRPDVLLGGPGDDLLAGRGGADVLAGGLGADELHGRAPGAAGTESDLLVAGPTDHDGTDGAWRSVLAEWRSSRSYASRTTRLAAGTAGLPALNATTVFDDEDADSLVGGGGKDWIFAEVGLDTTDRLAGERLN